MSPLYRYNGALLRVGGALASSQNCCCDGDGETSGSGDGGPGDPFSPLLRRWRAAPDPAIIKPEDAGTQIVDASNNG